MTRSNQDAKDIKTLSKEIAALKSKVDKLETKLTKSESKKRSRKFPWRSIASWLCIAIAAALLFVGNLAFWAGNTLVDTDRYVAAVGPLIQEPEIQSAIAGYTTTQLFNRVDVQGYVQSALPPRAEFLAPQLSLQLKTQTENSVKKLLATQKVQDYWYSSLAKRHEAIIGFSKAYQGNGTIEISDLYSHLSKRLSDTRLSFLADRQLPDKVGTIQVATVGWLPVVHKVSNNIGLYQAMATFLLISFSVGAVLLSSKRRRTVITLGFFFAGITLATLLATKIAGGIVASQLQPIYQSAAQVAYSTVFASFVTQTVTLLLISALIVLVAWLSGPYRSAALFKTRVTDLLSGRLRKSIFGTKENTFTLLVSRYKRQLQWTSVLLISLVMLLVQLSPKLIIVYGFLMLVCVLVVELLAADNTSK
ncbi:MAG: hypothetical protein AAB462_02420 [Patescibacteria group bacterium]